MRLGEHYTELCILRLKFIFSVEGIFTFALMWGSVRIMDMMGIEIPSRWADYNKFVIYQIGLYVFFITIMIAVYALGEFFRRKYKLKSILFYDTSDNEVKQRIISMMQKNPKISEGDIADSVGLYIGHTQEYIRKLKKSGLVEREGKFRNRLWVVKSTK